MIPVRWIPREPPLSATGLLAEGPAVAIAVAAMVPRLREDWLGVAGEGFIVVTGPELPWVDGVTWLGQDADVGGLWWPTRLTVDVPVEAFARRIHALAEGPAVVLPERVIPMRGARPVTRARLEAR